MYKLKFIPLCQSTIQDTQSNVSNLEKMISFCTGYGGNYNPTNSLITLPNLSTKHAASVAELANVNLALAPWRIAVNDRENLFDPLSSLATRILNAVQSSGATAEYIKDVKTITRKLQGKRAKPIISNDPNTPIDESQKMHSVSQMTFDQRIENLDKLIDLLSTNPLYNPNETDLQIATLTTLRNNMIAANTTYINVNTTLSNARIQRNVVLYDLTTGLVKLAEDVKKYVKSVFGATSEQFRQVNALKFTYPNKR